jgi:hypothetical protein
MDTKTVIDKVYITTEAKKNACILMCKENPHLLFVAWFSDTAKVFKEGFNLNGIATNRVAVITDLTQDDHVNFELVFLEHYPLAQKEIVAMATFSQESFVVLSAMDEPLFKHFGSDKMLPFITLLGFKKEKAIEHSYVTAAITKGQQKIAALVLQDEGAESQAQWLQKHLTQNH